jgi:hypothetical protein
MSRDFLVKFSNTERARDAQQLLETFVARDGQRILEVENRGASLFCMLSYTAPIDRGFTVSGRAGTVEYFDELITHVSIENAIHRSVGYFLDTGVAKSGNTDVIPLTEVFARTVSIWEPMVDTNRRTATDA